MALHCRAAFLLFVVAPVSVACSSDDDPTHDFSLKLAGPYGDRPSEYVVVVAPPGANRWLLACPANELHSPIGDGRIIEGVSCTSDGLELPRPAPATVVTVKATGYAFETRELSLSDLGGSVARLDLTFLSPATTTNLYATGMATDSGRATFLDFAVSSETEFGKAHSVKFYIADLKGSPVVYFQNTKRYPLHYDFARDVLGVAASRSAFAAKTYSGEDRSAMAGTLTYYSDLRYFSHDSPSSSLSPVTLEFFPSDDLSPALAFTAHQLLESRLQWLPWRGLEQRLTYLPATATHEQVLQQQEKRFLDADAPFASRVDMYAGVEQQLLNPGVAYGTLRLLSAVDLTKSVLSFRDIALLTFLPNDMPLVGGTLTDDLQTPLAHVNLAARARGTPNLALRGASSDPRVAPFIGKLVRFEVTASGFSLAETTLDEAEMYWSTQHHELIVPRADVSFEGLPAFEELTFPNAVRVGTKAANLAELRQLLGEQAPSGFAIPFSAYDRYMTDNRVTDAGCASALASCTAEGRAAATCAAAAERCTVGVLAQESLYDFVNRLLGDPTFVADSALREACLAVLRSLIAHGTVDATFGAALDSRVAELFGSTQVRLRSSTNSEDLPGFNGAGLYESVSAYASGAHRASQRVRDVWASTWLWRAFEERQFWNIDHKAVRMGIAVNPAVDDEAANGVLITQNLLQPGALGYYVNVQPGEAEVTNPEGGLLPEVIVLVPVTNEQIDVVRERFSSLSQGQAVLSNPELTELYRAAEQVERRFAQLYETTPGALALDIEFKFHTQERRLLIKQARPYTIR